MNLLSSLKSSIKFQNKEFPISSNIIVLIVIFTGISIRLFYYLQNPALWLDEATLSLNIINRDYSGLLKSLDTLQVAPIGFLFIEKFIINIFGPSEYALRLLPFLAGIMSIPLFYLLAKKLTDEKVALISLLFFIFGRSLIYYSFEVKQYNLDVFVFIFSFLYFQSRKKFDLTILRSVIFGIIGGIFIWVSHISVIVLAAIGIWNLFLLVRCRNWDKMLSFLIMGGIWVASFAVNYYFFLGRHAHQDLQETAFGSFNFFPPLPISRSNINWYSDFIIGLFKYPLEIKYTLFAIIFSLIGVIRIIRKKQYIILSLFIPIVINFILALGNIYPCKERLILYNASAIIILLSYSIYHSLKLIPFRNLLIGLVVLIFLKNPIQLAIGGFSKEEIRRPMEFIGENHKEDDLLYVQYGSRWSFEYYKDKFIPENTEIILGAWIRSNPETFDETFNSFLGRDRVWLLFSHYTDPEKEIVMSKCEQYGQLLEKYEIQRSGAYLFSFK